MAKTIYRLVSEEGDGIYANWSTYCIINENEEQLSGQKSPSPHDDALLKIRAKKLFSYWDTWQGKEYLFGFRNKKALKAWFEQKTIIALAEAGAKLFKMTGKVIHGSKQSIILESSISSREEIDLWEFAVDK